MIFLSFRKIRESKFCSIGNEKIRNQKIKKNNFLKIFFSSKKLENWEFAV